MAKLLPIGTRVRARYDLSWPGRGLIAHRGALGHIANNKNSDAKFGMYPIQFDKADMIIPCFVAPAPNASVEVVE